MSSQYLYEDAMPAAIPTLPGTLIARGDMLGLGYQVTSVTVTAGGSGYASPPSVSFSGIGGATAVAVLTGGVVTSVNVTNGGIYPAGTTPTITFGSGAATATAVMGSPVAYPATNQPWDTNLATTQTDFAANFIGVSEQDKAVGTATPYGNFGGGNAVVTAQGGVYEWDCASTSFNVGDYVGPAQDVGNDLLNQTVVKVASKTLAIARVTEPTSNQTRVRARLLRSGSGPGAN